MVTGRGLSFWKVAGENAVFFPHNPLQQNFDSSNCRGKAMRELCVTLALRFSRQSEKCVAEGSRYACWVGLYISFHLS